MTTIMVMMICFAIALNDEWSYFQKGGLRKVIFYALISPFNELLAI